MLNKKYWLNRIKADNSGEPLWIKRDTWYLLKENLKVVEKDDINGMVKVSIKA